MRLIILKYISFLSLILFQFSTFAGELRIEGTKFVDREGATVLLRGWNMSAKIPPYDTSASEESFSLMRSWGANVIRLSYIWEAMEPERGKFQEDYLQNMDQLVQWAGENDIWVIIDIHQDSFSRYSLGGCGEGFPEWAVSGEKAEPDNGEACEGWGRLMYEDYANDGPMQQEWQAFYGNHNGVRDEYFAMLEMLAQRYRTQSNVIGIDLMNEPFGDTTQIYDLYKDAAGHVHAMAPDWILFLSPHAMTSGSLNDVSFGDKPDIAQFAFSPHYYDPLIMSFDRYQAAGRYMGETDGFFATLAGWFQANLRTALSNLSGLAVPGGINVRSPEEAVADLKAIADEWNVPLFIGEFGTPEKTLDLEFFLDEMYAAMDKYQVSGAQWVFAPQWTEDKKDGWNHEDLSSVDDQGNPRRTRRPRAYPQRIAGEIQSLQATWEKPGEDQSIGLKMNWVQENGKGNTRIFLPRLIEGRTLAEQFDIAVDDASWEINEETQLLEVSADAGGKISLNLAFKKEMDESRCRIFFKHNGFSCSDGVAIEFSGQNALGQQRNFVRFADYPWDETYDFGEWQMYESIEISATRNSSTTVTHTLEATPAMCGSTVTIDGDAWCFNANWDLVLEE
ncbi:MAG: cellulase family glycosylhydrolase [Exilibacterium sp.]